MKPISTILFDFDGTLADTKELVLEIYNRVAPKYKTRPLSRDEAEMLTKKEITAVAQELGLPLYKIPVLAAAVKKELKKDIPRIPPFSGIPALLDELKNRGYKLGILSSNNLKNIKAFLALNNLNHFDYLHAKKDLFGKDHALRKFLKKKKLSNEELLYIGDEVRDIQACRKAGVTVAAVSWGYNHPEALKAERPGALISHPGELLEIL